ncbi:MAG: HEAT repeat domain-containing protein, partial [Phycisphaerae bacterium]|nr:HEAT repeat domain-containing protein [Phycisphaerae bacterium]
DGDLRCDRPQRIVFLDTTGTYPHNGLSGIAFDRRGDFHFGLGENLGHAYKLIGADQTTLTGGGEGGSTYHVGHDGNGLRRVATGFWNPFGMCVDGAGRIFATDNDPSSSPPCRLIHVVSGGNYGYEYRYGRSGRHPLVSWNGDLPGTLPMVAGTGEAPCGILSYRGTGLPQKYRGRLLVASWADHRIETYRLRPRGLSFGAERETMIQASGDFRPVDIAVAPDGSLLISDWVSSSYQVHRQGRIWRVFWKKGPAGTRPPPPSPPVPPTDPLAAIGDLSLSAHRDALLRHLGSNDPFARHAATLAAARDAEALLSMEWKNHPPRVMAHLAVALRRSGHSQAIDRIPSLLTWPDPVVRLVAVKWIADDRLEQFRPALQKLLGSPKLTLPLFQAASAALDRLDKRKPTDTPAHKRLFALAFDSRRATPLRRFALRLLDHTHRPFTPKALAPLLGAPDPNLRLEAIRSLADHPAPDRFDILASLAADAPRPARQRAEAIAALAASERAPDRELLSRLARSPNSTIAAEAMRALPRRLDTSAYPKPSDTGAWLRLIAGTGDPAAGERIFFHSRVATCARCHTFDGRGTRIGPDLTGIGRSQSRRRLLESLLQPAKEVAPEYRPWEIKLTDGRALVGLPLRKGGRAETYLGLDGRAFSVRKNEIKSHGELPTSIMTPGLVHTMTPLELRDLIAFLAH